MVPFWDTLKEMNGTARSKKIHIHQTIVLLIAGQKHQLFDFFCRITTITTWLQTNHDVDSVSILPCKNILESHQLKRAPHQLTKYEIVDR